ncbi:hypothetical protein [Phenylobacterium sp.]|uniref:hypothetical protein n=1 Tax=Phenylobacterium sp. TaxID=1871053 RepID=UPI00289C1DCA|nr:hypothetical protein [Phenylobacterium sp.]
MRFAAPLVLALALAASSASAAPPIEAAFGNTVVSTFPDGKTQHIWLDSDGGYTAAGRRGQPSSGRWSLKADEICLRQLRPFPAPIVYCTPVPKDAATVAWTSKALNGQPVRLQLVRGRFPQ